MPNVGIIVGKQAVLVIETGMGARNAETILKEVAKVGAGKPIYLVTTHVHPEHDMGAHVFPKDSKLIRSKDQVADIAAGAGMSLVPLFTARSDLNKELLRDAQHRPADITFDREYMLDLGGVEIIEGYRRYLTRIRDRAAGLKKAGKSQDETIQAITDEMVAQYPDKNRLAGAIRAAYSE